MNRRGAATVEFALVLPVVMLFALACADFGRVVHAYVVVSNAARCGAEFGGMHKFTDFTQPHWEAELRTQVEAEMQTLSGFEVGNLESTVTTSEDSDGLAEVTVTVRYPFRTAVTWPGVPTQVDLNHRVVMRQIR